MGLVEEHLESARALLASHMCGACRLEAAYASDVQSSSSTAFMRALEAAINARDDLHRRKACTMPCSHSHIRA
jgi:hypothetical protein